MPMRVALPAPATPATPIVALNGPAAGGAKRTIAEQVAPATTLADVHVVLVTVKPAPLTGSALTANGATPVFVTRRLSDAARPCSVTDPKSSTDGVSASDGGGPATVCTAAGVQPPVPSWSISTGPCARSPSAAKAIGPSAPGKSARPSAAT